MFALFALGPHLLVAGNDTGVPLPYDLLNRLPFLGAGRVPLRFTLLVSLALAVLAGFGLTALWNMIASERYRAGVFAILTLSLLVLLELFGIPRTLISTAIDPFFATIAAEGGEGANDAVLELPYDANVPPAMYDQTDARARHSGRIHLSALSLPVDTCGARRGSSDAVQHNYSASHRHPDPSGARYCSTRARLLRRALRGGAPAGRQRVWIARTGLTLETIFEAHNIAPMYKDDNLTAYKVPPQVQSGPIAGLGDGWYLPQQSGARQWRTMSGQAQVLVTNPLTATMPVTLTLSAFTEGTNRSLFIVALDGQQAGQGECERCARPDFLAAAQPFSPASTGCNSTHPKRHITCSTTPIP